MEYKIIKKDIKFPISSINSELTLILKLNKNLFNNINEYFDLAFKSDTDEIVLFLENELNEYCLVYDKNLYDAVVFFLEKFLNKNLLSINISFSILKIIENIKPLNYNISEIFKLVKWAGSEKGLLYYRELSNFSDLLKKKVFINKLSLKDAFLFHMHFKKDYDKFLKIIPEKNSFSNTSEIIKNVTEYSKKENKDLKEILSELKSREDILTQSFKLKYPYYSKIKKIFSDFINKLKLPKNIKLKYDETFEKEEYTLEIKFSSLNSLKSKVKNLNSILENNTSEINTDLFLHENLFNTSMNNNEK